MARNVLITGGNGGIGYEMAVALPAQGDALIITDRTEDKNRAAVAQINAQHAAANIQAMTPDPADFANFDCCTATLLKRRPVIDLPIPNARLYPE